jgi:heat-inducible transcriptional repressor
MISDRQRHLLTTIIREYIKRAQPVGSQVVTELYKLPVSPATVRNDMAALEENGYLIQPHTSAGRVPTERAWRFYLDQIGQDEAMPTALSRELTELVQSASAQDVPSLLKIIARKLAGWAQETVVVAFTPRDLYYTGLSELFQQPEFEQHDLVTSFSGIMDHLDSVMEDLYPNATENVQVLIGQENPFSPDCGAVIVRTRVRGQDAVVTLLGPTRQAYHESVPLMKFTQQLLQQW